MRAWGIVRRAGATGPRLYFRRFHFRARRGLSFHRALRICRHDRQGGRALAQRLFVGFFHLVGTHGAHVISGLIWLIYLMVQAFAKGLRTHVLRRLLCFSLFWHTLDIVWIGVLTLVYLMGAR